MKNILLKTTISLSIATSLIACGGAKEREATLKDKDLKQNLIAISDLAGNHSITLSESITELKLERQKAFTVKEEDSLAVKQASVPAKIKSAVSKLLLKGKSGETFSLDLLVEGKGEKGVVTAYKTNLIDSALSTLDMHIATKLEDGKYALPAFQIKIKRAGVLEREKNADGENTSNLTLTETPIESAEYVELDLEKIETAGIPMQFKAQVQSQLIDVTKVSGQKFKVEEIQSLLGLEIAAEDLKGKDLEIQIKENAVLEILLSGKVIKSFKGTFVKAKRNVVEGVNSVQIAFEDTKENTGLFTVQTEVKEDSK